MALVLSRSSDMWDRIRLSPAVPSMVISLGLGCDASIIDLPDSDRSHHCYRGSRREHTDLTRNVKTTGFVS